MTAFGEVATWRWPDQDRDERRLMRAGEFSRVPHRRETARRAADADNDPGHRGHGSAPSVPQELLSTSKPRPRSGCGQEVGRYGEEFGVEDDPQLFVVTAVAGSASGVGAGAAARPRRCATRSRNNATASAVPMPTAAPPKVSVRECSRQATIPRPT